jgi:Transglycosylase SLT domain
LSLLTLLLWLGATVTSTSTLANIPVTYSLTDAPLIIRAAALHYGANPQDLLDTLYCESHFNAGSIHRHDGKGDSVGTAQINSHYHPEISRSEALDPIWSIEWAAQQFAAGRQKEWSCYGDTSYERATSP